MKLLKMIAIVLFAMVGSSAYAQSKTEKIKVLGNCGMCKNRIEKGLKSDSAISSVTWDKATKLMTVSFDTKKTNVKAIHQKVANLGHDTELAKASDAVYEKLPSCCKYDRTGKTTKSH